MKSNKFGLLAILMIILSTNLHSQDYMVDIAKKSCECLTKAPDTLDSEQMTMGFGLCMIEVALPYKKQLKKDFNIDMDKIGEQGKDLGQIIGIRMASVCPEELQKLAGKVNLKDEPEEIEVQLFEGKVTGIEESQFLIFSVKDDTGKISKFYWLTYVESEFELATQYKSLLEKNIMVTFMPEEFFDHRINEYRSINVIRKINMLVD